MNTTLIHVLIILWFPQTSQSGKDVHTHEFRNQETCQKAADTVNAASKDYIRAWCVQK